jgi:methyl coenzyme M reductase alpha subunit
MHTSIASADARASILLWYLHTRMHARMHVRMGVHKVANIREVMHGAHP